MSQEHALLGIDLGTSQVKALLCDPAGEVLGRGVAGYSVRTPRAGWAETDPAEWWTATVSAVGAAVAAATAPRAAAEGEPVHEIAGVSIVGQMHGAILTDAAGNALRPAILWLDQRSDAEVEDYKRLSAQLLSALGNAPSAGMAGPSLLWVSRHEPDVYRRARWLLQPKDWLRFRLTGAAATDPTDASGTLLFDMAAGGWATDLAKALGLRTDILPPLLGADAVAGRLRPEAADRLGLRPGLPVATGASDTAAALLAAALPAANVPLAAPSGAAPSAPGWGLLTLGTGGQWVVPAPPQSHVTCYMRRGTGGQRGVPATGGRIPGPDPTGKTNLFCAVDGSAYRLAAAQNVGVALDWVIRVLGASWADLYRSAGRPWDPGTPVFLPFLAGERWDSAHGGWAGGGRAGGCWDGLALSHGREDLLRAALEGVAFLLRTRLEDLRSIGCRPEQVVIAGGGSHDPAWRQLLGDVLALPMHPARDSWLSARGAALIAGVATGTYATWEDAIRAAPAPESAVSMAPVGAEGAAENYRRYARANRSHHAPDNQSRHP